MSTHKSDVFRKAADQKTAAEAEAARRLADDNRTVEELYSALTAVKSDLDRHDISTRLGWYLSKYRAIMLTRHKGLIFRTTEGKNLLRYSVGKFIASGSCKRLERNGDDYSAAEQYETILGETVQAALEYIAHVAVQDLLPAPGDCTELDGCDGRWFG